MAVEGSHQKKNHLNPCYKAAKQIDRTFLISDYY